MDASTIPSTRSWNHKLLVGIWIFSPASHHKLWFTTNHNSIIIIIEIIVVIANIGSTNTIKVLQTSHCHLHHNNDEGKFMRRRRKKKRGDSIARTSMFEGSSVGIYTAVHHILPQMRMKLQTLERVEHNTASAGSIKRRMWATLSDL